MGTCFVLMPFQVGESTKDVYADPKHWDEVYEGLIKPAVERAGFRCIREDKDLAGKLIVESILRNIESADIIVCDLSSHNPNVFLELGWSLRGDKPYVLIKDELTEYTFDLANVFAFRYSSRLRPITLNKEIESLTTLIKNTASDQARRYSLVRTLEISESALQAASQGEYTTELLLDIRRQLADFRKFARLSSRGEEDFPWPILLKQGTNLLIEVKGLLEQSQNGPSVTEQQLADLARNRDVWRNENIQFSVIDSAGIFLYHDWLTGLHAAPIIADRTDLFLVAQEKPFGAAAWIDQHDNIGEYRGRRLNVALFASTNDAKWRVVVELHHVKG